MHRWNEDCWCSANWLLLLLCTFSKWLMYVEMKLVSILLLLLATVYSFALPQLDLQGTIFSYLQFCLIFLGVKIDWHNLTIFSSCSYKIAVETVTVLSICIFLMFMNFMFISEDALYALKLSLNASPSQLTNWNKNQVNPCTWSNVYCDQNSNVVQV